MTLCVATYRKVISGSLIIYRRLLRVYPKSVREKCADKKVRYFEVLCKDSLRRGGLVAFTIMWVKMLYELAVSAKVEREKIVPQRQTAPSVAVLVAMIYLPGAGQAYNRQPVKSFIHTLAFLALIFSPFLWYQSGEFYLFIPAAVFLVYSALDAWITARKSKVTLRADV